LTPLRAVVALEACSGRLKITVALPRLLPFGPYCIRIFLGLPTPIAEAK